MSPALRYVLAGENTKLGGSGSRVKIPETSGMTFMDGREDLEETILQ